MQVETNHVEISRGLFAELFKSFPETKTFFKELFTPDGSDDDWQTPEFEFHMVQVLMPALGQMIRTLHNPQEVKEMMRGLGRSHRQRGMGLKKEHIEAV